MFTIILVAGMATAITSVSLVIPRYGNFTFTLKARPSSTPLLTTKMSKDMLNLSLRYTGVDLGVY